LETIRGWKRKTSHILRRIPHHGSTDLRHHPLLVVSQVG
jgi:hypothetical protein